MLERVSTQRRCRAWTPCHSITRRVVSTMEKSQSASEIQALDVPHTILRPPHSGLDLIARPHIFGAITGLRPGAVAKLVAPAGAGKTTVLGQAHAQLSDSGVGVAWLSVTPLANDHHRFLLQLIAAVRVAEPQFAATLPALLEGATARTYQDVAMKLALAFSRDVKRRLVLFIDDYHCIDLPVIHQTVAMLLDHLPPEVSLVIGSRAEPDLPVSMLRANGRLVELDWDDLRFSEDEAAQLFSLRGCALTPEQLQAVHAETEGWATGLQLVSIDLAGNPVARTASPRILPRQLQVTDYWQEVVLDRLPQTSQAFLLRTSVLDALTPDLCDALTENASGGEVLGQLERLNLFTFRLDDDGLWYRYHHLFREFLLARLGEQYPRLLDWLHVRASEWFEQHGYNAEAVDFALRGHDAERAARLLVSYGRSLFRAGRFKELRLALGQLPEPLLASSAELCILNGWSYAYGGEFERAHTWAEAGQAAAAGLPDEDALEGEIAVLQGALGVIQHDKPDRQAVNTARLERLEHSDSSVQAFAHIVLGYIHRADGRLDAAEKDIDQAIRCAERSDCSLINMLARFNHAALALLRGERSVAESSARGSIRLAEGRHWSEGMGTAFTRAQLGTILYQANRIQDGLVELNDAIAILRATEAYGFLGVALLMRAQALWAGGWRAKAQIDLRDAGEIGESRQVARVRFRKSLLEARMALSEGEVERARRYLQRAEAMIGDTSAPPPWSEHAEMAGLVAARLAAVQRRWQASMDHLDKVTASMAATGRWHPWLEARALTVEVLCAQNRPDDADAVLMEALEFASQEELWQPFFEAGRRLRERVSRLARARRLRAAVVLDGLLAAPLPAAGSGCCEPLHARERQILALVADGVTNREIGRRLYLSEETVKWYLKGLYRKLDVENRTAAVARARELSLLDEG